MAVGIETEEEVDDACDVSAVEDGEGTDTELEQSQVSVIHQPWPLA